MTTEQVLAHYGNQMKVAGILNISRQAVNGWGERPPLPKQYELEVKSGGALKADRLVLQEV